MDQTVYEHTYIPCPHNGGVQCRPQERNCKNCGWDPDVAQNRLEKICKKLGIALPIIQKEEKP